ncbi:mycofactocin precursor MftA [Sporichthya sp.]|nr:mycofactocin precursor MftA [Sporichthya sp.]MBA3745100.1 mycofactocin precursor [Sporichthya sp.]
MPQPQTDTTLTDAPADTALSVTDGVAEDLLVEDVSIDGMCGVY